MNLTDIFNLLRQDWTAVAAVGVFAGLLVIVILAVIFTEVYSRRQCRELSREFREWEGHNVQGLKAKGQSLTADAAQYDLCGCGHFRRDHHYRFPYVCVEHAGKFCGCERFQGKDFEQELTEGTEN